MISQIFHCSYSRAKTSFFVSLLTLSFVTSCTSSTTESRTPEVQAPGSETVISESANLEGFDSDSENPNLTCGQLATTLTVQEREYATTAWQYFINNRQQETGFTNAANQYPSGTLWDQGNY
ncbi:MAG: DUF3131 domain-containing protein, partial [Cyanobacteria bacterium P01_D01_bin.56]